MRNLAFTIAVISVFACGPSYAAADNAVLNMIQSAKPGATVRLPAGTFKIGDIVVPSQVTIRGDSYEKTTIDASGSDAGLIVRGVRQVTVSDLTVRNARSAGIVVGNARTAVIRRVRSLDNGIGLRLRNVRDSRVENIVAAGNQMGIVMAGGENTVVANSTFADNRGIAITLTGSRRCAVFNNLFVNSQLAINCGEGNLRLSVDHNLYVALFTGGMAGEVTRESLPAWRDLTGFDAHSVELPVAFAEPDRGDYRPVRSLRWNLERATTADWGAAELAGFTAPPGDIDGNRRHGNYDLGAYEVTLKAPRPADGTFEVRSGEGVTSAGLFTRDGNLVAYLFHNLPLSVGTHKFWLPTRDHTGTPIPAGTYELRTAESRLSLEYLGLIADGGVDSNIRNCASIGPEWITFDNEDNVILAQSGVENHQHIRSLDHDFASHRWVIKGDGGCQGAAVDENGMLYRLNGNEVLKVEAATGLTDIEGERGVLRREIKDLFSLADLEEDLPAGVNGIAALNGRLYVADTRTGRIFFADSQQLDFAETRAFQVDSPRMPAADRQNSLLWVLSGEKVLALDPETGAVKHAATPAEKPAALAVCNRRLAVSSLATHKVHVFDCTDPANLRPLYTIGSGNDGAAVGQIDPSDLTGNGQIAIDGDGRVAVIDHNARLFSRDGAIVRWHTGFWGQFTPGGYWTGPDGGQQLHFSGMGSRHTVVVDPATRTWRLGARLGLPEEHLESLVALFTQGGKNFAVYTTDFRTDFQIIRFDNYVGKILQTWTFDKQKGTFLGTRTPKAIANLQFKQDGRLFAGGCLIPRVGVAEDGAPKWDWSKYAPKPKPYGEGGGGQGRFNFDILPNGAWIRDEGPGRGFGGGFTTFAAYNPDGSARWKHHSDHHNTMGAMRSLRAFNVGDEGNTIITATMTEELDTVAIDQDGLGLGVMGVPREMRWEGFWHDQDWSIRALIGADGQPFLTLGDYVRQSYHWFAVNGWDRIRRGTIPVVIDDGRAAELAVLEPTPAWKSPAPPTPRITVAKLREPLHVDGDPAKWRQLNIEPQIVHIPAATTPDDCSALIRMAWHNDDLYVQVIRFDDVVTFHQGLNLHYKQDSTELALIGGFMGGYKFAITRTTDHGNVLYREQFLMHKELNLDPTRAPRVIKVLDNAKDITERKIIESMYGADLSHSKVIITEFKIPMTHTWDGKLPITMTSGTEFWFGFFIDDNDEPGSDLQKAYPWPVTYAAFGQPDQGAKAVLE